MESRQKILGNIPRHPAELKKPLPVYNRVEGNNDLVQKFCSVLESIGGKAVIIADWNQLKAIVASNHPPASRIFSTIPELPWYVPETSQDPHSFENLDLTILKGHFGVAENGAVWLTEGLMGNRVTPFIAQHLAVIINKGDVVSTLHEAYDRINGMAYDFGIFIAGPSKTADIEQSLVLGAHGPKSITVFLLE
jgi:L-lactate dehydrogenase complex protein LldG